jgi:hypothetical protein
LPLRNRLNSWSGNPNAAGSNLVRGRIFLGEISTLTPNMVSVQSVKNGKSHSPIGGISVAVKSTKGEIRVSENRTLGLRRWYRIYLTRYWMYITRLYNIHHKILNTHHKILNIHHKIIEYASQDFEYTLQFTRYWIYITRFQICITIL